MSTPDPGRNGRLDGYAAVVPALEIPSLDPAERRALERFVGLLRHRFSANLEAVLLFGLHADGEPDGSKVRLLVLLEESSRSDRVAALELLWQAAVAERATEHYFSIRITDRAAARRSRAIDEFLARKVEPDGIVLFARPGSALRAARELGSSQETNES